MFQPDKLADLIAKPAHDPRSIERLIAWLEQRIDGKYDYLSYTNCLICQYASHFIGASVTFGPATEWSDITDEHYSMFRKVAYPIWDSVLGTSGGGTYSGALARARAYARAAHNEVR